MGLVELGQHTGLSPALLSKIERGRLFPTLPTLLRIALVFSVGLEFFFAGAREKPLVAVVRESASACGCRSGRASDSAYRFESLDYPATERRFNSYYAELLSGAARGVRLHDHPGVEFIYTLQGTLSVHIGGEEHAPGGRRLDVFRLERAARVPAQRRPIVQRARRDRLTAPRGRRSCTGYKRRNSWLKWTSFLNTSTISRSLC